MQHFFRYTLDGDPHLNMKLIYAGLVIAIIIAYRFRKNDKLLKVLLATNVLLQIILFIWYLGYKELFIMEGLPISLQDCCAYDGSGICSKETGDF